LITAVEGPSAVISGCFFSTMRGNFLKNLGHFVTGQGS